MATVITAVVAFVATNVDDIFLLAVYFTQVNTTFRVRHIVLGQYIGFAAILAVSLLGFVGALLIPEAIIGLLGFAPIYIGIKRLLQKSQPSEAEPEVMIISETTSRRSLFAAQTYSVAVVTLANGGDNISIYIPLFAGKTLLEVGLVVVVFALLIAVWCYLGYRIGNYPALSRLIHRYGHFVVPIVLIGLGIFILVDSGTIHDVLTALRL